MRARHTKDKGDLGVLHAKVDTPFDPVGYKNGRFLRVQVKYRAAVHGSIPLGLKSSWSDRNGTHDERLDKDAIDVLCIYCPDTRHYLDPSSGEFNVRIRIESPRNNQVAGIRWARDLTEIPDRFK